LRADTAKAAVVGQQLEVGGLSAAWACLHRVAPAGCQLSRVARAGKFTYYIF
jgi:hypothetical protein